MAELREIETTRIIRSRDIRVAGSRTLRFVGDDHGSGVSFYLVTNAPGQGPGAHRHPYTETWVVLEGEATIGIGTDTLVARSGDSAVVQPHVWHGFTNTGSGTLRIMCIHASPTMLQDDLPPGRHELPRPTPVSGGPG